MELKGLNKLQLSKLVGSSHTTVGRWLEADGFVPRAQTAHRVADALNINAQWLLEGEGPMTASAQIDTGSWKQVELKMIPVISWAHAGQAVSYEELPVHWQEMIPSICKGPRAFSLVVEGDSMEPRCMAGDIVAIDPDEDLRNGCMVVAKLRDDGIILRRYVKIDGERVKLIPYNTLYPSIEYSLKDFHWIYPVHSTTRREL